jgi:peptidoglycan/xylan/chitin deacetylase (PgdA/CDA1 family)
MYHRFPQPGALELHCRHIARHYTPVSMQAVARWLSRQEPLPPNPVAATVDDGYRCFLDVAYPIFSKYRIPVTVYLATDFVDGISWFWDDRVRYSFLHTSRTRVEFERPGQAQRCFRLDSRESRMQSAFEVNETAKMLPEDQRRVMVEAVLEALDVRLPAGPPDGYEPLSWDSVRWLARQGVEFGAHTKSHAILSRLGSESAVFAEVEGSRRRIEEEIQTPVTHFCYPNGRPCDIDRLALRAVRSAGFHTAVTTRSGLNRSPTDPYLLSRIGATPDTPEHYLAECLAGFHL